MKIIDAILHNYRMNKKCNDIIKYSVKNSVVLEKSEEFDLISEMATENNVETTIEIMDITAEKSAMLYNGDDVSILNFASFKTPGGGFMKGSTAQEESLCHNSTLYQVLRHFKSLYIKNRKYVNNGLYYDVGIFSPRIHFGEKVCNVLTVAAPNYNEFSSASVNRNIPSFIIKDKNNEVLRDRIDFVLNVLRYMKQKTIILGAFGCGVFKQHPSMVASIFKELLETKYKNVFEKVIFAIPKSSDGNHDMFKYIFNHVTDYGNKKLKKYDIKLFNEKTKTTETIYIAAENISIASEAALFSINNKGYIESIIHRKDEYLTVEDIMLKKK